MPPSPAQQRHQLVGVDEAAPPGLDQLAGVVVERLHRRGRRFGEPHRQAATGLVPQAHHRLDRLVGPGHGEPAADDDLLEAQALGERGQPAGDRGELVEGQVDDGPDVEQDAVPLEAVRAGELGPGPADGVEAADEDVLDLREGDDAAVVVAHRRHVADLGDGDEPLVRRRVAGDAVEEVDLARGTEGPDLEVLQAPHLQAAGDHRVQAAELDVLGEGLRVGLRRHPVGPDAVRRRPVGT